jgi:phosphoenolpyruvate carboxykinase (GTP)
MESLTKHTGILSWIEQIAQMTLPDSIVWCNGTKAEYDEVVRITVDSGLSTPVRKRPNSYLFRSDASDVARIENRTYIASRSKNDAGPTNNWIDPFELKTTLQKHFKGCMRGRVMYVIPFSMGPIGSPIAKTGIQLTDSPYVVANMHIMTRVGRRVLEALGDSGEFIPCLHSVGKPLLSCQDDGGLWPCAPLERKYIAHFPEEKAIWSFGSGYGGNALLGKKCFSLRTASVIARDEGWLAEHMLILKITNPEKRVRYIAAAFPSACGKTNLSMLVPTISGWKVETIGDDIAWMKPGKDGKLYAINPEAGFFGVAPGTSLSSNPNAMRAVEKNTIFTNVAMTEDGDVWWEGIGYDPPGKLIDWRGNPWVQNRNEKNQAPAAHPNSRFTVPAAQCPSIAAEWENPAGVPIDAILFGGRRPSTIPLVTQAFDWNHGVFMGSVMGSEVTAAALDLKAGSVRRDPFAMLPFCGYHMGDYFAHWIRMGEVISSTSHPKFFLVNWFRKTGDGKFLWPGYGENSRVLKWVFDRCDGEDNAISTSIGLMPKLDAIEPPEGVTEADMRELLKVDLAGWKTEIEDIKVNHYPRFGDRLPPALAERLEELEKNVEESRKSDSPVSKERQSSTPDKKLRQSSTVLFPRANV